MQLMSWTLARLGSRFSLHFEPHRRRVLHSALGRFLDQPIDLMVGLIEPDGTERVLPFTTRGTPLMNGEQFERLNSITFRGYSEKYRLQFEFNVHSVFYPQDEELCLMPAFYLEARVNPVETVRRIAPAGDLPSHVTLLIRLIRPDTLITPHPATGELGPGLNLAYSVKLSPSPAQADHPSISDAPTVTIAERIVSLNPDAVTDADGRGLTCRLPVSEEGSGVKWRLVWAAHCAQPVLTETIDGQSQPLTFQYTQYWSDIDQVMQQAIARRDNRLMHSRRLEKLFEQAPLEGAQRHLIAQGFQNYLGNAFWCRSISGQTSFTLWNGNRLLHSAIDVEFAASLFALTLWPDLLWMQLDQWPRLEQAHAPSKGSWLLRDLGYAHQLGPSGYTGAMPVATNSCYLLMLQVLVRWTGSTDQAKSKAALVRRLADYLLWSDREDSGFATEGTGNTLDDAAPATRLGRKLTFMAILRVAALQAAADLLDLAGESDAAMNYARTAERAAGIIQQQAWLGDHFAVCADSSAAGIIDSLSGQAMPLDIMPGWDAYSLYTSVGLLLPMLSGRQLPMDTERLRADLTNAARESLGRYGCGHSSSEPENVRIGQNLWRDHAARYIGAKVQSYASCYWDLQVMSNSGEMSMGFADTYIGNDLSFCHRGAASLGTLLAEPRLVIDNLAPENSRISVEPDTHWPQRWPLLPLADWKAGKVPVCVVDSQGNVTIEGQIDPILIRSAPATPRPSDLIG